MEPAFNLDNSSSWMPSKCCYFQRNTKQAGRPDLTLSGTCKKRGKMSKAKASVCAQKAIEAADRQPPIPYSKEDCQMFVEETIRRAGGFSTDWRGSNDMFRNACSYVAPLAQAKKDGRLVPGAVLFILKKDGGEPDRYKKDGLGNASHIGWYTGGKYEVVHSSASRGGVYPSTLKNAWTHVGWMKEVDYTEYTGEWNIDAELKPIDYNMEVIIMPIEAIVNTGEETLNVRKEPRTGKNILYREKGGSIVKVLEQVDHTWSKIEGSQGVGYAMSKFLVPAEFSEIPEPPNAGKPSVVITCGSIEEADAIVTILRNAVARRI